MSWTARDALQYVYPILTQYGANHALGNETFLHMLNIGLAFIRSHKGYRRTWQHRKDNFTSLQDNPYRLITTRPIRDIDNFYCGEMLRRDGFKENILCTDCDIPQGYCAPCTPCGCKGCKPMDVKEVLPSSELCPGEYAITGSNFEGMGGFGGQIIRILPKNEVDSLWVTYYREFSPVKSFDDQMPIPISFMHVLAEIMSAYTMGRYGQFRIGEDNNFFTLARIQLDELFEADQQNPREINLTTSDSLYNLSYR